MNLEGQVKKSTSPEKIEPMTITNGHQSITPNDENQIDNTENESEENPTNDRLALVSAMISSWLTESPKVSPTQQSIVPNHASLMDKTEDEERGNFINKRIPLPTLISLLSSPRESPLSMLSSKALSISSTESSKASSSRALSRASSTLSLEPMTPTQSNHNSSKSNNTQSIINNINNNFSVLNESLNDFHVLQENMKDNNKKTVVKEKPFPCSKCSRRFYEEDTLKIHLITSHED